MIDIKSEYKVKVAVFGSRNAINDPSVKLEMGNLAKYIVKKKLVLANGGSVEGLMGYSAKMVHQNGGEVHGIGLQRYEPYNPKKHIHYTEFEGYLAHWERQKRLIELGDIFIAFKGGFGTLSEVIDIYLLQGLAEVDAPLILIGEYMEHFNDLLDFFEKEKMGRHMLLESNLHFVKTAKEAEPIIDKHIKKLKAEKRVGADFYPSMDPEQIYNHIRLNGQPYYIKFENIPMKVLPDVFPSNRFRSSKLLGSYVKKHAKNKNILDMGCGGGTMGLVAALNGAKSVVQIDLNPNATNNARINAEELKATNITDIYTGNGFKPIVYKYKNYFDIIFFNPPFHSVVEDMEEKTELMYALYSQGLEGGILDTFFRQAKGFLSSKGELMIVYSNKDPKALKYLEAVMIRHEYSYTLDILSKKSNADVRVYRVKPIKKKVQTKKITSKPLKLGVLLATTGNASVDGLQMKNAIELAVDELKGSNHRIELGFSNDASSVTKTVTGAVDLIKKFNAQAIIGPTWSELIDSVSQYYEDQKILYYIPATSLDILSEKKLDYVLAGSYSIQGKESTIRKWLKQEKFNQIIYITRSNVLWGQIHKELFQNAVEKSSKKLLCIEMPKKASVTNINTIISKFIGLKNSVIIIDNYNDFYFDFLSTLKKKKIHMPIISTLNIAKELQESIQLLEPPFALYELNMSVPRKFTAKYNNVYNQKPSRYAFNAYIGTYVLAKAFRENSKNPRKWIIENWADEIYSQSFNFSKDGQIKGQNWSIERIKI